MLNTLIICRGVRSSMRQTPARIFYPLTLGDHEFRQLGVRIRYEYGTSGRAEADIAIVDCKLFYGKPKAETLEFLRKLRNRAQRVIWLDNRDSAGNTQFEVLPYVDWYGKCQLYRDRANYDRTFAGNRMHTDYFAKLFGFAVEPTEADEPLSAYQEHTSKLEVAWNSGFRDYISGQNVASRIRSHLFKSLEFPTFRDPRTPRPIDVNVRFGLGRSPAYSAHRQAVLDKVSLGRFKKTDPQRISRADFLKELQNSKIAVSPFGWGEVCYRDFEATINGCCIIKPDMAHLQTWPDIYRANKTYAPIKWDLSDLLETINGLLADEDRRISMVMRAQEELRSQAYSPYALANFCRRQREAWTSFL